MMEEKRNTILLVDDEPMNLKILSSLLKKKYTLMIANGGKKALEIIEQGKFPDLILLDIMMPDLDGYSVCTLLKSDENTKDIPIMFISAMDQPVDEEEGLSLGAVDYIKKPFVPSIVLARVETQLKLSKSIQKLKNHNSSSTIMNRLVKYKNNQIEMILNNSGEGFLIIDSDFTVQSEHSRECDVIFGYDISGKNILEILSEFSGFDQEVDEEVLRELFGLSDQELAEKSDVYIELLPVELNKSGEVFSVRYSMIISDHLEKRLLIVLRNITEKKHLQKKLEDEHQKLRMIVNIASNLEEYQILFKSARVFFGETIYEGITKGDYMSVLDLYIKAHTFKGSFGQMNILEVCDRLDKLEDLLSSYNRELSQSEAVNLTEKVKNLGITDCLDKVNKKIEGYLGFESYSDDFYYDFITVNHNNLRRIEEAIKSNPLIERKDLVFEQLKKIRFKSLYNVLQKFCHYSKRLSGELKKERIKTNITGEDIFLDPDKFGELMGSLVHIFRNIVDHGIENPEERYKKGKEIFGTILCEISNEEDDVLLTISDDGRGIDIDELKKKLKKTRGLTDYEVDKMKDQVIADFIFEERFSSLDTDHSFSGRGIGLSAVKNALRKIGGTIHVRTVKDRGSSFVIRFTLKGDENNR